MTIYDPFDTFTNAAGNIERRPFAGNIIPKTRMDPVALKALSYFPMPNQASTSITETNNWFNEGINQSNGHQMNAKGDLNLSDKSRISGRYSYSRGTGQSVNLFGAGDPSYTYNGGPNQSTSHATVADYTRTSERDDAVGRSAMA